MHAPVPTAASVPSVFEASRWPQAALGDALQCLTEDAGVPTGPYATAPATGDPSAWLAEATAPLGLEAEPVSLPWRGLDAQWCRVAPALLRAPADAGQPAGCWLLCRANRRWAWLQGPDGRRRRVPVAALSRAWAGDPAAASTPAWAGLLARAGLDARHQARVLRALREDALADRGLDGVWLLRPAASQAFLPQLRREGVPRRALAMLACLALGYGLEIQAWALIGAAALEGRLDLGWLAAWVLLMLSLIPLRSLGAWLEGCFALDAARLFKQRLLVGALRADPDRTRADGIGATLSRVMEAQALEGLALGSGLALVVALLELGFAAGVLALGAAPAAHLLLLGGLLALALAWWWRHAARLTTWTDGRLALTHDLLERMIGHRTRLLQEQAARRDAQEDAQCAGELAAARQVDRSLVPLVGWLPGLWLLGALALLAGPLLAGRAAMGPLAISLGGVLLAHRALHGLAGGGAAAARALVAWRQVAALFRAGGAAAPAADGAAVALPAPPAVGPLLQADALGFRHAGQHAEVLRGVDLQLKAGDRVLLQGASGSGKSSLVALLTGWRQPTQGSLLLAGLDRGSWGPRWHRLATAAPQFHDNHVLAGTLAFNLLLGREEGATEAALAEAEAVCRELGLGPLIERMPAGLQQRVGETGWQLSHGEKSRIFLARALLQQAPLTLLDESFAALDPPTLRQCLDTAVRRSRTLVVVAHP
ncbi:ATP-binding cassette domain-containing protein [Aquabacterium sp.]|uniref:ATP-binding cassette domain-containing protein n=1 Tax=Aquabacterium sp. TaxID=1872578 RepID=UPI003783B375